MSQSTDHWVDEAIRREAGTEATNGRLRRIAGGLVILMLVLSAGIAGLILQRRSQASKPTLSSIEQPGVTPTFFQTATPLPTLVLSGPTVLTPLPTATPLKEPTAAGLPSPAPAGASSVPLIDRAEFVADVTAPDGTRYEPGVPFTKTWRVRNAGTSTWGPGYALVFHRQERMNGLDAVPLPSSVLPGEVVDLSVELVAPEEVGTYRGDWMLGNSAGQLFGVGPKAAKPLYVEIEVTAGAPASSGSRLNDSRQQPVVLDSSPNATYHYFLQNGQATYLGNYANEKGCRWMGIVGQVFDAQGNPQVGLLLHLQGGGLDLLTMSGGSPAYGPAGFEFELDDYPRETTGEYQVQLLTPELELLSSNYSLSTFADCDQNLILMNFVQGTAG